MRIIPAPGGHSAVAQGERATRAEDASELQIVRCTQVHPGRGARLTGSRRGTRETVTEERRARLPPHRSRKPRGGPRLLLTALGRPRLPRQACRLSAASAFFRHLARRTGASGASKATTCAGHGRAQHTKGNRAAPRTSHS